MITLLEYLVPPEFFAELVIAKEIGIINGYGFDKALEYKIKERRGFLRQLLK